MRLHSCKSRLLAAPIIAVFLYTYSVLHMPVLVNVFSTRANVLNQACRNLKRAYQRQTPHLLCLSYQLLKALPDV